MLHLDGRALTVKRFNAPTVGAEYRENLSLLSVQANVGFTATTRI